MRARMHTPIQCGSKISRMVAGGNARCGGNSARVGTRNFTEISMKFKSGDNASVSTLLSYFFLNNVNLFDLLYANADETYIFNR